MALSVVWLQTDMKRLIAFSAVAHMGFVMLGISTLTDFGINAAIMGMVAHGLITGMLFFLAGSMKERYHTLEIKRLGGLLVQAPKMGWILGFCAMASLGLPGLAGFWGEFPAILSAYNPANGLPVETFRTFMVVAALGTVLAAGYFVVTQRAAFGTPKEEFAEDPNIHDATKTDGSLGLLTRTDTCFRYISKSCFPNYGWGSDASLTPCLTIDVDQLSHEEMKQPIALKFMV